MKEKTLENFCTLNPFHFSNEQLEMLRNEIKHPRKNFISDEQVDFILWCEYGFSRQDYFAEFVTKLFKKEKYTCLLEVGCGYNARLARLLSMKDYKMTAMDPKVYIDSSSNVLFKKELFNYPSIDISMYDGIIAQEPCDASEPIIRACIKAKKDFIIALCGVPHVLMNGSMPTSCDEWYTYLENLDNEHIFLLRHVPIIPGFNSNIILGKFSKKEKE